VSDHEGRVFLRGIASETYGLAEFRRRQRAVPRVRRDNGIVVNDDSVGYSGESDHSRAVWVLAPWDDTFFTQTLQVHFVELAPGGLGYDAVVYLEDAPEHTGRPYAAEGARIGT